MKQMRWYVLVSTSSTHCTALNVRQVSQMEIEIQAVPQSIRPQYETRLRSAKGDLALYKTRCRERHTQLSRSDLFGPADQEAFSSSSDNPYTSTSDRTRLLAGTQLLEDGTNRLKDSQRIALETEGQGADILLNLRTQREQIENSRDTVHINRSLATLATY
jgi:vesicle transport through interaction with t-SNAREs protein 1